LLLLQWAPEECQLANCGRTVSNFLAPASSLLFLLLSLLLLILLFPRAAGFGKVPKQALEGRSGVMDSYWLLAIGYWLLAIGTYRYSTKAWVVPCFAMVRANCVDFGCWR
jgi:hypothetical protein